MEERELEKRADELLDEKKQDEEAESVEEKKTMTDPAAQLRELCRGKLKLMQPFRAHGQDVNEIAFDFCELTGMEMMDALDSVPAMNNMFGVSNKQAMALFALTAEKCAPLVKDGNSASRLFDAKDVKGRMHAADAVKAMQLAKLFYNASSQAGNSNISKE